MLAAFAISFLDWILVQQFAVVALLAPTLVAGAITEEKTRHTLEHLLTTQINPLALIVGKLLARMVDVVVLTLVVLPMAAFVGPYAGRDRAVLARPNGCHNIDCVRLELLERTGVGVGAEHAPRPSSWSM